MDVRLAGCRTGSVLLLCCIATLTMGGCASLGASLGQRHEAVAYPGWIRHGSTLSNTNAGRTLWGLGEVRGIRNVALARASADNRARAEVARLLGIYLARWLQKLPPGAEPTAQTIEKLITAKSLGGTQIVEHWFHPHDGSVFSLARLEVAPMVQSIDGLNSLNATARTFLAKESMPAFDALLQNQAAASQ